MIAKYVVKAVVLVALSATLLMALAQGFGPLCETAGSDCIDNGCGARGGVCDIEPPGSCGCFL